MRETAERGRAPLALLVAGAVLVTLGVFLADGRTDAPPTERSPETRKEPMPARTLSPEEERVIVRRGTEAPFSGAFHAHHETGTYHCRRCGAALFDSDAKFDSGTGWPSFDESLPGAVREVPDPDGTRTEIVCAACGGHLGHVFRGEGFTGAGVRHCVNSVSLDFTAAAPPEARAYFAGGCFWGVEHQFETVPGVRAAISGYMGGRTKDPSYEEVCHRDTGHVEVVEVVYDPTRVTYEELARLFFEIHDPTQVDRQGPDVGEQYRSVVFYADDEQRRTAERLIRLLERRGLAVATALEPASRFWKAEAYHQDYYRRTGKHPYCHSRQRRFGD